MSSINGGEAAFKSLTRHPEYYIPSADLCFLVGNIQFRVHRYFFERESAHYRRQLSLPVSPGAQRQGTSDAEPLVLTAEDATPEQFEKFCWVFYNPRYSLYTAPTSSWATILTLAQKWSFPQVKALAIRYLELFPADPSAAPSTPRRAISRYSSRQQEVPAGEYLDPVSKIALYQNNDVDPNLLIPSYITLVARERPISLQDGLKLGMETTLVIASAREYVRSQRNPDGSRSPIDLSQADTPATQSELVGVVREVFGINEDVPEDDYTANGVDSKQDATDLHTPLTASASTAAGFKQSSFSFTAAATSLGRRSVSTSSVPVSSISGAYPYTRIPYSPNLVRSTSGRSRRHASDAGGALADGSAESATSPAVPHALSPSKSGDSNTSRARDTGDGQKEEEEDGEDDEGDAFDGETLNGDPVVQQGAGNANSIFGGAAIDITLDPLAIPGTPVKGGAGAGNGDVFGSAPNGNLDNVRSLVGNASVAPENPSPAGKGRRRK